MLGTFSKGNDSSGSINFSESGAENCEDTCNLKDSGCYAVRVEKLYKNVKTANIQKRELGPVQVCNKATLSMRNLRNYWVRFSVLGSLPKADEAKKTKGFKVAFQNLLKTIEDSSSLAHIPVESPAKRRLYQKWASEVSDKIVIRESCQNIRRLRTSKESRSFVVGKKGTPMQSRLDECRTLATELRSKGEKTVVCPAIKPRNFKGKKAKCGSCRACASKSVDVILYALH